jgi:transposase
MQTFGAIIPGAATLARLLPEAVGQVAKEKAALKAEATLSREAKARLKAIRWCEEHGHNVSLTAAHFGYSRVTIHNWLKRYKLSGPAGLEDRSHRPRQVRQRTWSSELEGKVLNLRQTYPRWGKDKLVVLLRRDGEEVSTSMVGRILKRLKDTGQLVEPLPEPKRRRGDAAARPYAIRKPRSYLAREPGDIVEVDTVDLRPLPGVVLKHFTTSTTWSGPLPVCAPTFCNGKPSTTSCAPTLPSTISLRRSTSRSGARRARERRWCTASPECTQRLDTQVMDGWCLVGWRSPATPSRLLKNGA